ncbi:urea ABC transporter substrate-binding protein [Haladaptatus sp. CMSO5]|uniref:urea ABC transporter substrate-binding protein n=1 Tax=Haladaptatus sp. CMSO5 TaxID=3120514 RepID=UPI002FCE22A4
MTYDDTCRGKEKQNCNQNRGRSLNRRTVLKAGALGSSLSLAGCVGGFGGGGDGAIKIGLLADRSGSISTYGIPMTSAAELWQDEVNNNGGLLGRDVELIKPDPQSDNQQYQNLARRLILEEEVDMLVGGITSASREAIRPIIDENKQLYFYPALYEGGVCDEYVYMTGPTPTQQLKPLVEYMVEEFGGNVYTLAADYNFGQISALWAQRYVEENGGSIVGEEFIPLSVSDFGSTIDRVQNEDPDWIMSLLVGTNHVSYFKQAESTGLQKPMASTVQVGASYEHKTLSPPTLANMYSTWNYLEELPSQANQDFVSRFRDMFPETQYINQHAESTYVACLLYQAAVEQAETTDQQAVNEALESGISVEAPQGTTTLDPATHHLNHNIALAKVEENHSISILETTENVEPTWLQERCSLASESTWDDPTSEFFQPN